MSYVTIDVHRGPKITGFVSCGKDPEDDSQTVLVAMVGKAGQPGSITAVERLGPWLDYPPESLECEAMLFAAKNALYVGKPK